MDTPPRKASRSSSPLAYEAFRAIWLAAIFSNVGTFVQSVGESWLMLSLTKDPLPVAMLTTAFTLPSLVLMMPAGVMADRWDRRAILLWAQGIETVSSFGLALCTAFGATTPAVLLTASVGLGIGSALSSPAWNSLVPELVPRNLTADAVTLNSVAYNIARAVGPALGGLVLAASGPAMAFFLNALSFLAVIEVLRRYPHFSAAAARSERRHHEPVVRALVTAFTTARRNETLRAPLLSVFAFGLAASNFPALLPVLAKTELGASASGYGSMLGAIGVGAVLGAVLLQRWRSRLPARPVVVISFAVYGAVVLAVCRLHSLLPAVLLLLPAGVGWISSLSSLNALTQLAAPVRAKSRILALYQLAFLSAWTIGSSIGGVAAGRVGVPTTLTFAGLGVLAAAALTARLPIPSWDTQSIGGEPAGVVSDGVLPCEPAREPLVTPVPASAR